MARRTVELGHAQVEGIRMAGDSHLVLLRVEGKVVELPVSPGMVQVVKDIYGERPRISLTIDDFDPSGEAWKETSPQFFRPSSKTGPRAKPEPTPQPKGKKKRALMTAAPEEDLVADTKLLQEALETVGGVQVQVGPRAGLCRGTYQNVTAQLATGHTMTDKVRDALRVLVESGRGGR